MTTCWALSSLWKLTTSHWSLSSAWWNSTRCHLTSNASGRKYNPRVIYTAGKNQVTADALLRAPADYPGSADSDLINNVAAFAKQTSEILPATTRKLQEICEVQEADDILLQVREDCTWGWPVNMPENTFSPAILAKP